MQIKNLSPKKILILILMLAAISRLFRLDFPNKFIFDEVYHAFTAKEYLAWHKEAWEWWTTPPPGVAYEWTHPPLAKEIMATSMFIFHSQDGWAWRLPGVLLGVLSVYVVYLLGIKLLNNQLAALIAAFVFSIDGLNFVQSRTGMNDIYFVSFMLLSLLFFLRRNYIWSSVFVGLSLASKWAAIYIFAMYFIVILYELVLQKDKFLPARNIISHVVARIGPYLLIPPLIYFISYIPFFLQGHSFEQFIHLQQQMWWYHTNLKATHGYASPWWSWPLNLYPVWYFVDYGKNTIANIFASGNPVVFWLGFISIILTVWETFKKRSKNLIIILLGFFIFWLPWAISPRIMFLYHYSPSIPFMCLSLGYLLSSILKDRERQKFLIILLSLCALSFILIYPFLTAIHIPRDLVKVFFSTNLGKNPF